MEGSIFAKLDETLFLVGLLLAGFSIIYIVAYYGRPFAIFAYNCFLKPITGGKEDAITQQDALESFYQGQAAVYDATRTWLLSGREDFLALAVAQIRLKNQREGSRKRVWVDVGGGTGYNIEKLNSLFPIAENFSKVYLVDLSPSLCAIARKRFEKLGWRNVEVLCTDARTFHLEHFNDGEKCDWITLSYALSMIPDYYSVIDSLANLLAFDGIISVVDFYVQSSTSITKTYTGGLAARHVNWFSRQFWRMWFEFDRVNLDESRRDYLEYRFGTVLSFNGRNTRLGGIPYYIWLGCPKLTSKSKELSATPLPGFPGQLALVDKSTKTLSRFSSYEIETALANLAVNVPLPSSFYQNNPWRRYYDELQAKHRQFNNTYIYAFTWEDPVADDRILKLTSSDSVLAITSAGDNILSYLFRSQARVHAVDLNPTQNHLFELKLAAFSCLPYDDIWQLFGLGRHPKFRSILVEKLSPHLSSRTFQYWLAHAKTFTCVGLYHTGHSRIPLKATSCLLSLFGRAADAHRLCTAETLAEQREIWRTRIRPVLLSKHLSRFLLSTETFLWSALGVPRNQKDLILSDSSIWEYVVDTLDPVVEHTLISEDNYFYLLCLTGQYTPRCHPQYLDPSAYKKLSRPGAFDSLNIYTDHVLAVVRRMANESLTVMVLMDSMDWFSEKEQQEELREQLRELKRVLKGGGRVLLRSAAKRPWYVALAEEEGFATRRVAVRAKGACMDRVNMYASTWVLVKRTGG